MHRLTIWDLPTRFFHWLLALSVAASVATAKLGGDAMVWHLRLGYWVLGLLLFRFVWGFVGGYWSRFLHWPLAPSALRRAISGQARLAETVGHSATGSWAVIAMLTLLAVQIGTGLVADDEIATSGPFAGAVNAATSALATRYHHGPGQWVLLGMIALHLCAIAFYVLVKRQPLVQAMWTGRKDLETPVVPSVDTSRTRMLALAIWLLCLGLVWRLVG